MSRIGLNIYKRKDGRWEGRKKLERNQKYTYFYGKSYREVKNKMEQAVTQPIRRNSPRDMCRLCVFWLDLQKTRIKQSSYAKYHNIIYKYLIPFFSSSPLSEIHNADVARFAAFLRASLSRKTVSDILCLLKSILSFGGVSVSFKNYTENKTPQRVKTMPKKDVCKIIRAASRSNSPVEIGIALTVCTGLRIGELCALKWSDIDFDRKTLSVNRTMQRIQVYGESHKTKVVESSPKSDCSIRTIPLPDTILQLLSTIKCDDAESYLLTGTRECIEPRRLQYLYKKFLQSIGADYINFHALRHTFATNCVAGGFDVKCLSEILGHATIHITLDKYVHPSLESKRANMLQFSSAIFASAP